jgi:hypothetical protein
MKGSTKEGFEVTQEGGAQQQPVARGVVQTSFAMDVGETVVVGTSKLDGGDAALVVLLTAVAAQS